MEKENRISSKPVGGEATDTEKLKTAAADMTEDAKRRGREQFEARKHTAADQAEKAANAVERFADDLADQELQSFADYAGQLAGGMRNFAETVRGRSIDELIGDTQRLARNNPALFMMGSVAVGIALSRFAKASSKRRSAKYQYADDSSYSDHSEFDPVTSGSSPPVPGAPSSQTPTVSSGAPSFSEGKGV